MTRVFEIAIILLLTVTIGLGITSYTLWQKHEDMIRDDYRMYLTSQYNLRDVITNSLKVKYERAKLIDSLVMVKGEFMLIAHITDRVKIPEKLQSFNKRGLYICNKVFFDAIQGKPLGNSSTITELHGYKEELDQLLLQLNSSQVIDNNTPESIYQKLEAAGKEIEQ